MDAFGRLLRDLRLSSVVETGARFLLDAERKHRPTLLDAPPDAARRLDFLKRCVDLAARLSAPVVNVWSGAAPDGLDPAAALDRLVTGLSSLCAHARGAGVRIGFEPEPGMAVETASGWESVRDRVGGSVLGLTLDVGHCLATREGGPATVLARHAKDLVCLHLDDAVPGVHEHRMFGEGAVRWDEVSKSVKDCGYLGPLEVELSRHSHEAPAAARRARDFLRARFG